MSTRIAVSLPNKPRELHATYILPGSGEIISGVHARADCIGRNCCIHDPSDHAMRDWAMVFRHGRMYRRSPITGRRYLDPDDIAYHRMVDGWDDYGTIGE